MLTIQYLGVAGDVASTVTDQWQAGYPYSVSGLSAANISDKSS